MYHVDTKTSTTSRPIAPEVLSRQRRYFTVGNPSMGVPATIADDEFLNMVQDELLNLVEDAGLIPDKPDYRQVSRAVKTLIARATGQEEWDGQNRLPVGGILGEIKWLMHAPDEIPLDCGCYFCNGERHPADSPQGKKLLCLPATLRVRFNITQTADGVNVPLMFRNGKGCFIRAADGITRLSGSIEEDALREFSISISGDGSGVAGTFYSGQIDNNAGVATGVFSKTGATIYKRISSSSGDNTYAAQIQMDLSGLNVNVATDGQFADESRPLNIALTPVIYLGV